NDTDESVKVNLDRIRLNVTIDEDNKQAVEPLSPDGVANVVMSPKAKDPQHRVRLPLPVPLPKSDAPRDKHWVEIEQAARDAGVPGPIVAPHKTMQGLLYFDLQGQLDLLSSAHLYMPEVTSLEKNKQLLYFDIDLSRSGGR